MTSPACGDNGEHNLKLLDGCFITHKSSKAQLKIRRILTSLKTFSSSILIAQIKFGNSFNVSKFYRRAEKFLHNFEIFLRQLSPKL